MPEVSSAEIPTREGTYVHPQIRVHWIVSRHSEYLELTGDVLNCSGEMLLNMEISTHFYPVQEMKQGNARFIFLPHAVSDGALLPFGMRIAISRDNTVRQIVASLYYERQGSEGNVLPVLESFLIDIPPRSVSVPGRPEP